ncbi:uncharacterized protein LOC127835647 [Dreissena polymorpha]|uniref:uncharacterized protein LOC127835647 n=1 Tax=Dreissena polymorpha TaxID=45954 RepID=UPI002264A95F|nr:uncharacterized protein LOC127835647 [Dreissena polymorpha]
MSSSWLVGPHFSGSAENKVPYCLVNPDEDKEVRPEVTTMATNVTEKTKLGTARFSRFSSWTRLLIALSCIKHIANSFLSRENKSDCTVWHVCSNSQDVSHHSQAAVIILREVQKEHYADEYTSLERGRQLHPSSPIGNLSPLDEQKVMRVGGRLKFSDLPHIEKHPVILPESHNVACLLVEHFHRKVRHQGRHFTEGAVRAAGYWIVGGKRLISSVIHNCVTCRKLRGSFETQKMADLPRDRLTIAPPFSYVGVDTFCPWQVVSRKTRSSQASSKRWAIIFTCLAVRAIHIEVVVELSSSAFTNALRRLIAIRGPVKEFRSDRGTNFTGAIDLLEINSMSVEQKAFRKFLNDSEIIWRFNPPHSSHFGGVWERMIGVSRRIIEQMLMNVPHLTHDVLVTFMAKVCAIVNSRPITPVSSDPENPEILTPAILLTQKSGPVTSCAA